MSDPRPDIDIDAERMEAWWEKLGQYTEPWTPKGGAMSAWKERARIAAEREHTLLDLLADAQHAVCCYSCPEPREGEPERHCDLCRKITAALAKREERA